MNSTNRVLPRLLLLAICAFALSLSAPAFAQDGEITADGEWHQLFNGKDLDDWVVKLNHHEVGDNYRDTFRVEDGVIKVRYDKYDEFNTRFGHLNYKQPFSHYHLAVEYRFVGEPIPSGPSFGRYNSGVMLHSQDPKTVLVEQDWPISLELQFLATPPNSRRPVMTGAVCTPGTAVEYKGNLLLTQHIIQPEADAAQSFDPETWVRAEAIVRGHDKLIHIINGKKCLEYNKPIMAPGVVNGADPAIFIQGTPLSSGFICLQSEGQPCEFRKVEIKVLKPDEEYDPVLEPKAPDQNMPAAN